MKIIKNAKYNSQTDLLFRKLRLLKLDGIIEYELRKIAFHVKENILP